MKAGEAGDYGRTSFWIRWTGRGPDGRTDGGLESRLSLQDMQLHGMDSVQLLDAWRNARANDDPHLCKEILAEMECACTEEDMMHPPAIVG